MGRIRSGVRVSASFQKKPAGFCPTTAKSGLLNGRFLSGWGLGSYPTLCLQYSGLQSSRHKVNSSHSKVVTWPTRHRLDGNTNGPSESYSRHISVYSDTTQLDVELSCVELRRRSVFSDADPTQLNSTRLTCFALIGCTLFNWVSCIADRRRQLSCVGEGIYSDATQLNSTSS